MERDALARHSLLAAILASVSVVAVLLSSTASTAAPWGGETTVSGVIQDLWLESDQCYFRISIQWSESGGFVGETVDVVATFLNESTGKYERVASSMGWMTGDEVNATLEYLFDEFGRTYWIELTPKSDENYAEPLSYFERNPFVLYLLLIVVLYVVLQTILFLVLKRKGRRGRYEGPDYMQYRRRI